MSATRATTTSSRARAGGLTSLGTASNPAPLPLPPSLDSPNPSRPPGGDPPDNPGGGGDDPGDDDPNGDPPDDPDRPPHIPLARWIEFQGLSYVMSNALRSERERPQKSQKPAKPNDPDRFDGSDPKLLDDFLFQCSLVFGHAEGAYETDSSKVLYAIQWLKGTAQRHFRNSFHLPPDERPDFYQDWEAFTKELRDNFGELDRKGSAVAQLITLKMQEHHKVLRYKVDFEELATLTTWDKSALRDHFYEGLAEQIKDAIAGCPTGQAPTLAGLKEQALTFDARYWGRKAEAARKAPKSNSSNNNAVSTSRSTSQQSAVTTSTGNSPRPAQPSNASANRQSQPSSNSNRQNSPGISTRNSSGSNSTTQTPQNRPASKPNLEGKVDKDGRLTEAEKQRRKDNGLCLYCEKKGHLVANCPERLAKEEAKARRASALPGSQPQQPPAAGHAKN